MNRNSTAIFFHMDVFSLIEISVRVSPSGWFTMNRPLVHRMGANLPWRKILKFPLILREWFVLHFGTNHSLFYFTA